MNHYTRFIPFVLTALATVALVATLAGLALAAPRAGLALAAPRAGLALAAPRAARQTTAGTHAQHLDAKGKQIMGFDQQKTTHHFLLYEDGGAIDVSVKNLANRTDLDAIRSHLPHIAMLFAKGDFEAPMLVHDTKDVPGIKDLARLKDKIRFVYAETKTGGRVDIVTTDTDALAAVHAFLKFQIQDHKTGDRMVAAKRKG